VARPKYPDRRIKGRMIARYEILQSLMMRSPQTARQLFRGVPTSHVRHIYQRLHQLEHAGYVKQVGKYDPKWEWGWMRIQGGWGILWAPTKKGEKFCRDYIYPNFKRGFLIKA